MDIEISPVRGTLILDAMKTHVVRSATNRIHNHPYAEIVIVDKGDTVYTSADGTVRLGDKSIVYNPPYSRHNPFVQYSRLYERYKIKFYPEDINDGSDLSDILSSPFAKEIPEERFDEIYLATRGLFKDSDGGCVKLSREALATLRYIMLRAHSASVRKTDKEIGYIDRVTEYISSNIAKKFTVEELAGIHFVSKSKLNYDFKAYTNMTVNEYITLARTERAKELLKAGTSVSAVAAECGFSSPSYFIKVFSDTVGTTPLKYQIDKSRRDRK